MNKRAHPYKDGDVVADMKDNEIFIFDQNRDWYKAVSLPDSFRLATDEEKQRLIDSSSDCITLMESASQASD